MASDTRDRSRSPSRPKKSKGGFKWKEKSRKDDPAPDKDSKSSTYRSRSPKYDSRHAKARSRSHSVERPAVVSDSPIPRPHRPGPDDAAPDPAAPIPPPAIDPKSAAAKFGARALSRSKIAAAPPAVSTADAAPPGPSLSTQAPSTAPDKKKKYKSAAPTQEMIIVHVNDRLGTKAAIPCLASDPVSAFKAMVAARIGRRAGEIVIKRQGERPFKDMLTLEDYGVGNGVQLDLELGTGE